MKGRKIKHHRRKLLVLLISIGLLLSLGFGSLWLDNQIKTTFRSFIAFAQDVYDPPPPPPPPSTPPGSTPSPPSGGGSCPDGVCQAAEDCPSDCAGVTCNDCGPDLCCDDGDCVDSGSGLGCWEDLPPGDTSCTGVGDCGSTTCTCPPSGSWDCTVECGSGGCYSSCTDAGGDPGPDPPPPPACTNTSPDIPTLNSPANGSSQFAPSVTLDWNPIASWGTDCPPDDVPDAYAVYVDYNYPPQTQLCWVTNLGTTECTIPNDASHAWLFEPGRTYYWRVVATNGVRTSSSTTWSYTMGGGISGRVFRDDFAGVCSTANFTAQGWTLTCDGIQAIRLNDGTFTCIDASAREALTSGSHTLNLTPTGTYLLSCNPQGSWMVTLDQATPNVTNYNLMITQARDPWFQAEGGELHADSMGGGITVQSRIPDTCATDLNCPAVLVKPNSDTGQAGAVSRASGTQEFGSGNVSVEGWQARAGSYEGVRADYEFWRQYLGDDLVDWDGVSDPGGGFWLASGDAAMNADWNVGVGEQLVLVVPGNLTINANQTVAEGGSLLVIASDTVLFDPAVTNAQGVYVAETIATGTTGSNDDFQFIGEGTFIGWNTITLARVLPGITNGNTPAELFIYRPDIVYNLPAEVKRPLYTWREVP